VSGPAVLVGANARARPRAGGHAWALGQWALGLAALSRAAAFADGTVDGRGAPADVVLNVMGHLQRGEHAEGAARVFLDIDPGYPQMWRELGLADMLDGHDRFATIGQNIGRAGCAIPDCGLDWVTTPPPVALAEWPATTAPGSAFTTVATWRNPYGTVTYGGVTYGSRAHEFRRFIELPRLVDARFELALDIDAAEARDRRALERHGWTLRDPRAVAATPLAYRRFIQGSRAEFCVAQHMYVATRSGWLSDRSVCYLASGRPVLAQDTGFSDNYPVGEGLLAFTTLEEAAAGVESIQRDYARHSAAARALAEEHFDAPRVLRRLLARLGWAA